MILWGIDSLPKYYQLIFKFAGKFKVAKEAHRIFAIKISK